MFTVLSITITLFAQQKIIKGRLTDLMSLKKIEGVCVGSEAADSLDVTGEKGTFTILLPEDYHDMLYFTHPGYYPYEYQVEKRTGRNISVFLTPRTVVLDTLIYSTLHDNKLINGKVYDANDELPVKDILIGYDGKAIATTNFQGYFKTGVPKTAKRIVFYHPLYRTTVVRLHPNKKKESLTVVMLRQHYSKRDTAWKTYRNELSFVLNELFQSAVAMRYQRFLGFKHAVGISGSYYFHGVGSTLFTSSSEYTGFKAVPFYRFYIFRKIKMSFFMEGKIPAGYFDFSHLFYAYKNDNRYGEFYKENFWSTGFASGVGFSFILPKTRHGIISFTAGFQIFSMHVPQTKWNEHYNTLEVLDGWWYFYGPGSVFEMKISVGRIF